MPGEFSSSTRIGIIYEIQQACHGNYYMKEHTFTVTVIITRRAFYRQYWPIDIRALAWTTFCEKVQSDESLKANKWD